MRNTTRVNPEEMDSHGRGDGFIIAAILCAAVMVAMLALHGGPDLLGGKFATGLTIEASAP